MRRSIRGSYTVEAAIILPVMILALLTLGSFIKVQGLWENVMHGAIDETRYVAARGYDGISEIRLKSRIQKRVLEENEELSTLAITPHPAESLIISGARGYRLQASAETALPLGFGRKFRLDASVRYRPFIGKKAEGTGLGREALETGSGYHEVVVFPQMGEKFHGKTCTYVKAKVEQRVLTGELKRTLGACGLCHSGELQDGSVVYCFENSGTAYHKGSCRSIQRRTITMDKEEAIQKGYTPCSKCGG